MQNFMLDSFFQFKILSYCLLHMFLCQKPLVSMGQSVKNNLRITDERGGGGGGEIFIYSSSKDILS